MRRLAVPAAIFAALALAACNRSAPTEALSGNTGSNREVAVLQRINALAYECWRPDPLFEDYSIIPELDTTGQPRILLLPRGQSAALPQLVVTVTPAGPDIYGPLAALSLGERINADVLRWSRGSSSCGGTA